MDKKKQILFNLNNFLLSISYALDSIEEQLYKTSPTHSKRIAFIALKLAKEFNYNPENLSDICSYSLLHNIALFETKTKNKDYCEIGQKYTEFFPFLTDEKNIIKYSCEYYNGSGVYGLKEDEIPLFSQFISFADTIDCKFDLSNKDIKNRQNIIDYVTKNENILFSTDIVECFCEFSKTQSFWLDLQNENEILTFIFSNLHDFSSPLDFEEILKITSIFSNIIDKKSLLVQNCEKICDFYDFDHKDKQTLLIAASLTNIGKFFIPNEILTKNTPLEKYEYEIIKSYPYYTKKILSNIIGFNDITNWASRIQEYIDGSGYPYSIKGKDLSLKDRLMAITHIFTALTTSKPYRKDFEKDEAFSILEQLASNSKIDKAIVKDIKEIF